MDLSKPFPDIPAALIERLEAQFPDRAPSLEDSDREVWAKAGEARLIRFLRNKFDEQDPHSARKNR